MPRPRKSQSEKRRHVINIRLTDEELAEIKRMALEAGFPYGRYIRETVLVRRPRARPIQTLILHKLLQELQSVATNCEQLTNATGNDGFIEWAKYAAGQMVERVYGREDLSDVIDGQLDALNGAGHLINILARKANSGIAYKPAEKTAAFKALKKALDPIRLALQPNKNKKAILDYPDEP